jgi:hypothetical protein
LRPAAASSRAFHVIPFIVRQSDTGQARALTAWERARCVASFVSVALQRASACLPHKAQSSTFAYDRGRA